MFLQGLRIWILYDCRRTEQPANSDLCRRNATVRMNFYVLIFWDVARGRAKKAYVDVFLFSVHLVDIWNVIEAFRENGLNAIDLNAELSVARLEVVLSTIFYQLNKRMPTTHQINVEQSISLLLNFLLAAYDPWVNASRDEPAAGCVLSPRRFWRELMRLEMWPWKSRLFSPSNVTTRGCRADKFVSWLMHMLFTNTADFMRL